LERLTSEVHRQVFLHCVCVLMVLTVQYLFSMFYHNKGKGTYSIGL